MHPHLLPIGITCRHEPRGGEAGRPEPQRRVARKAEPFARDAGEGIEPGIVVLVMDHGECVGAVGQAVDGDASGGGGNAAGNGVGIIDAAGEVGRVGGQAEPERTLCRTQSLYRDVKPPDWYRAQQRRCRQRRQPQCRA
jgi:hypothetical protein